MLVGTLSYIKAGHFRRVNPRSPLILAGAAHSKTETEGEMETEIPGRRVVLQLLREALWA